MVRGQPGRNSLPGCGLLGNFQNDSGGNVHAGFPAVEMERGAADVHFPRKGVSDRHVHTTAQTKSQRVVRTGPVIGKDEKTSAESRDTVNDRTELSIVEPAA